MIELSDHIKKEIIDNFSIRNINVIFFENLNETKEYLLHSIPNDSTIGLSTSTTLNEIEIIDSLKQRGNIVYDRDNGKTDEEIEDLSRKSLLSNYFISGSNAVSLDGRIINNDKMGNKSSALLFGPNKVFIVVGKNKLSESWHDALYHVKNVVCPAYAKQKGYDLPCVNFSYCVDCSSNNRMCCSLSVIFGQSIKDRMTLIIINENVGI